MTTPSVRKLMTEDSEQTSWMLGKVYCKTSSRSLGLQNSWSCTKKFFEIRPSMNTARCIPMVLRVAKQAVCTIAGALMTVIKRAATYT